MSIVDTILRDIGATAPKGDFGAQMQSEAEVAPKVPYGEMPQESIVDRIMKDIGSPASTTTQESPGDALQQEELLRAAPDVPVSGSSMDAQREAAFAQAAQQPDASSFITDLMEGWKQTRSGFAGIATGADAIQASLYRKAADFAKENLPLPESIQSNLEESAKVTEASRYASAQRSERILAEKGQPLNPTYEAYSRLPSSKTPLEALKNIGSAFYNDPGGMARSFLAINAPSQVPTLAAAAGGFALGGPPGAVAGVGLSAGAQEFGTSVVSELVSRGATDAKKMNELLADPNEALDIYKKAGANAVISGFLNAASAAATGGIAKLPVSGLLARTGQVAAGTGADVSFAGAEEAAKQLWHEGTVNSWNSIIDEMVGEVVGGAALTGMQTAFEKVGRRDLHKRVSEDELKQVWNDEQDKLPLEVRDPVSTFTEAKNDGRTLFAFVEKGKTEARVGSYEMAEAEAGAGDYRRGKLIAVDPAEVEMDPRIEQIADVQAKLSTVGKGPAFDALAEEYRKIKATFTAKESSTISAAIADLFTKQKQAGKALTADESKQQLVNVLTPILGGTYKGTMQGRGITPRVLNTIVVDGTKGGFHTAWLTEDVRSPHEIDLDTLKERADAQGVVIVPSLSLPNVESISAPLIDATFEFASPQARATFLRANDSSTILASLFNTGDVKWKGRLDRRFLLSAANTPNAQFFDKNGTKLSHGEVLKLADARAISRASFGTSSITEVFNKALGFKRDSHVVDTIAKLTTDRNKQFHAVGFTKEDETVIADALRSLGIKSKIFIFNSKTSAVDLNAIDYQSMHSDLFRIALGGPSATTWGNDFAIVHLTEGTSTVDGLNTFLHELGHVYMSEQYARMPLDQLLQLKTAWERVRAYAEREGWRQKNNMRSRVPQDPAHFALYQDGKYPHTFEEFSANQVARAYFADANNLGSLRKFYKKAAIALVRTWKYAKQTYAGTEPEFAKWIASTQMNPVDRYASNLNRTTTAKAQAVGLSETTGVTSAPQSEASAHARQVIRRFLPKLTTQAKHIKSAQEIAHAQDKFNYLYKVASNLRQLATANPHLTQLQLVREYFGFAKLETGNILTKAEENVIAWRRLGADRAARITEFMIALDQGEYLTPAEQAKGVSRMPTQAEFVALAQQFKIDQQMLDVYMRIRDDFRASLDRLLELQLKEAQKISDPLARQLAEVEAHTMIQKMASKPYFPQTRFGTFILTVRNKATNKIEHVELFETKGELTKAGAALANNPNVTVNMSTVDGALKPFIGVPPWLMDKIRAMPGFTADQYKQLEELRYQLSPALSMRKKLMKRKNYSGFSRDGMRVYASYMFHHARFYTRQKYGPEVQEQIDSLRESAKRLDSTVLISKRNEIADYLADVNKEWRNPSNDWAEFRALTAIWYLGFNVSSAVVNMSQVPLATYPWLAKRFGDVSATAELMQSARKLSTYYRKKNVAAGTSDEMRALSRAIADGVIDESMAAELAALAVGGGMGTQVGRSLVGDKFRRGWLKFSEMSMFSFRMAEQWNRRVTFRAAHALAMKNQGSKYVQEMQTKHALKFQQLKGEGWTDSQALSYLAAVDTVNETQFTYDAESRPIFLRGRKGALFPFFMFTQQMLWMMWQNKNNWARYALTTAFIAGPLGLVPDEIEDLLQATARKLFGKDFNLEREAREIIIAMLGEQAGPDGWIAPDLLLHGTARYGFGAKKIAELVGLPGADVDLSGRMSISRILPLSTEAVNRADESYYEQFGRIAESALGAGFGIPFSAMRYLSMNDLELSDMKRLETMLPTALKNASRSARYATEGGERTRTGAQTITFDREDPEQALEILSTALGFRPTRVSQEQEYFMASKEVEDFWQLQRQELLRQARDAIVNKKDKEAINDVMDSIKRFNREAPDKKFTISRDTLKRSVRAYMENKMQIEGDRSDYPQLDQRLRELYPETREPLQQKVPSSGLRP